MNVIPTPAPSQSSFQIVYPPWWASLLAVILLSFLLFWGIKAVLKAAEQKRRRVEKNLKRLRKRIKDQDDFSKANGYSYDFVFVFRVFSSDDKPTDYQRKHSVRKVVTRLCESGLATSMFYSVQQDEVYCKVRALPSRLQAEADRINYSMPLDAQSLKASCERGRTETEGWAPILYKELNKDDELAAFKGHYASYDKERMGADDIPFATYEEGPFRNVDRIKLIMSIIEAPVASQGCGFKIKDLVHNKACLGIFPLHDQLSLVALQHKWLNLFALPTNQPKDLVKDYFGEKIGLYFVWLGHYTSWLTSASFIGFICWTLISSEDNNPDSPSIPYFTVFMALWATLYLESWKRKEKRTALEWGMIDFESEEQSRPEFQAVAFHRESPVTGKQEKYFPSSKRYPVLAYSTAISTTFIVTVAGAIIGIYIFRAFLSSPAPWGKVYLGDGNADDDESLALGSIIGSGLNAVQILVMNSIYGHVAIKLTDAENHRTETAYEDALIAKTFSFQFVNSFMSLIYVAFIKQPLAVHNMAGEVRCYPNCFAELNSTLGIIILSNIAAGNAGEIIPPIIQAKLKAKAESKGAVLGSAAVKLTDVEKQFIAAEYDVLLGTFKDYGEMVIQFGYCTLFVAAFPLAPVLALVNNVIELRVDAWKLCQVHRRPFPVGAEDIGTWYNFLDIMSTLAVITNMALFSFTGSQLDSWSWKERVVFFVVMEHALLSVKYLLATIIPDIPEDVSDHLEREAFLLSKIVDNIADDVEDEEYDTSEMIDLSVKLTDLVPALDREQVKISLA